LGFARGAASGEEANIMMHTRHDMCLRLAPAAPLFPPASAGFESNFALRTPRIGGDDVARVRLADDFDNTPAWEGQEALYVEEPALGPGSLLDLNGITVYYHDFTDLGGTVKLHGGSMVQAPEPTTTCVLVLDGLVTVLPGRRHRRGFESQHPPSGSRAGPAGPAVRFPSRR
jgi:hypothetical protein